MVGLIAFQFVIEPAATLDYLGFLSLEQVGEVNSLSLYGISPVLWAISLVVLVVVALRLAPTRWGWAAAVVLSVFATPRLLNYQLSTLLAGLGGPDRRRRTDARNEPGDARSEVRSARSRTSSPSWVCSSGSTSRSCT